MTEDEANLTRCCGPEGCGGNSAGEPERFCIASRCMGWRWDRIGSTSVAHTEDERIIEHGYVSYRPKPPSEGGPWRVVNEYSQDGKERRIKQPRNVGITVWAWEHVGPSSQGRCGLAGKP